MQRGAHWLIGAAGREAMPCQAWIGVITAFVLNVLSLTPLLPAL